MALVVLMLTSCIMALDSSNMTTEPNTVNNIDQRQPSLAQTFTNVTIPYVDNHYGFADGIIDPTEYAAHYTDSITGVEVYLEHNSSILYMGLSASTNGWIGFGWKNYTDSFGIDGLNRSDLIYGYAPGTPHEDIVRVTGSEAVTVHYVLKLRNGTVLEEGEVPDDSSDTPISEEQLLEEYKNQIIGMRIGEVRHFIIPAEDAYNQEDHPLYGYDLEYEITLQRIEDNYDNPADANEIDYSYDYGISTYQHLPYTDQGRILSANARDDGIRTQVEYAINMNSTEGIPLLNATDIQYPLTVLFGNSEDIQDLPVQHSSWVDSPQATLESNTPPHIDVLSPAQNEEVSWSADLEVNVTDNSFVRRTYYKVDDENWTDISFNFQTDLWEYRLDLTDFEAGNYTIWFKATDASNYNATTYVNITVVWPFIPLQGMRLDVSRTLYTRDYHTTEIQDDYTVTNNGSAPITAFDVLLPMKWETYLLSTSAEDSQGEDVKVIRLSDTNNMLRWRVYLPSPVGFGGRYRFTMTTFFHSLHELTVFDDNLYEVTFLKYPVLPYPIRNAQLSVEFRSGDSLSGKSPSGKWATISPMSIEEFTMEIRSFTPFIVADRYTKVNIDPWGWLSYKETITLRNLGPAKQNEFNLRAPAYVDTISIYDKVGILPDSQPKLWASNETIPIGLDLRKDRFGQDGLFKGYTYTFQMDYTIQLSQYQSIVSSGNRIEFPFVTLGDILITKHTVDITMPPSVNAIEAEGDYRLLFGIFDTRLRYEVYNTTEKNPADINLIYQPSVGITARPFVFALVFGFVGIAYILSRRSVIEPVGIPPSEVEETKEQRTQTGAPPDLLMEFANAYSKRISLNMDLEKLEASRRRGKISKREYMIRERDIKSQLQEIDDKLPELKGKLIEYGSKYRDIVSQLELQNEKIEGAKAGLRQLLLRRKKQRISRVAFEKSRQDYLDTIKKATSATDRILLSMQEEAGEL